MILAKGLREHGLTNVRTATLDEPDNGLSDAVLAETDVLTWWGHMAHNDVADVALAGGLSLAAFRRVPPRAVEKAADAYDADPANRRGSSDWMGAVS